MEKIYGHLIYKFDEHFQRDEFIFYFDDGEYNKYDQSSFELIKSDDLDGIYFFKDSEVKATPMSKEQFKTYIEDNNIETDTYPSEPVHMFYTWAELWDEHKKYMLE